MQRLADAEVAFRQRVYRLQAGVICHPRARKVYDHVIIVLRRIKTLHERRHRPEKQWSGNRVDGRALMVFTRFHQNVFGVLPGEHQC